MAVGRASALLVTLEVEGRIRQLEGKRFVQVRLSMKAKVVAKKAPAQAKVAAVQARQAVRTGEIARLDEVAGGGGVADQGQDDPEVPGFELHRQGVDGTRPRPAQEQAGGGREEGLQARLPRAAGEEEGARRAQEGGREGRRPVHRDGPGPRRRGDRLAPRPGAGRAEGQDVPDHVQRDHGARGQGGLPAPRQDRHEQGGRPAGPARSSTGWWATSCPRCSGRRSGGASRPGRVQSVAVRLITEREREILAFVADGVLVAAREAQGQEPAGVRRHPARGQGREGRAGDRSRHHGGDDVAARRDLAGQERHARRAPAQSLGAVHHLHASAGGEPQAPLHGQEDHDAGAAALRGHRARQRGRGRPHHLHAHRRRAGRGRGPGRGAELGHGTARPRVPAGCPAGPTRPRRARRRPTRPCGRARSRASPRWWRASSPRTSWRCTA